MEFACSGAAQIARNIWPYLQPLAANLTAAAQLWDGAQPSRRMRTVSERESVTAAR